MALSKSSYSTPMRHDGGDSDNGGGLGWRTSACSALILAPLYVSWRMAWALRLASSDCDEVYNYWEPLHFLLYGSGQQTWEYSHEYALRTYAYVQPLRALATVVGSVLTKRYDDDDDGRNGVVVDRVAVVQVLRASVAVTTAVAELVWLWALALYLQPSSSATRTPPPTLSTTTVVPLATTLLLATCTGVTHAAPALLPSATWMAVWCACAAAYLHRHHRTFVVLSVTATLTTGWPFGAVCVVPMAVSILWRCGAKQQFVSLVAFIVGVTVLVQSIVSALDYHSYGVWTCPTLNIFTYNAGNDGDELYGVEPLSYYVKNLVLNLNGCAIFGILALPVYIALSPTPIDSSIVAMLLSVPAWFAVTLPRPHKEERFLFPCYPALIFGAVWTVDIVWRRVVSMVWNRPPLQLRDAQRRDRIRAAGHACVWLPCIALACARTAALERYYAAPLHVYQALSKERLANVSSSMSSSSSSQQQEFVCTCGEWYRFPGSFYLPEGVQLGFLPSSFAGQLPQPFSIHGSRRESQALLQPFNDQNQHEQDRYVTDPTSQCRWLVDLADNDECTALFQQKNNVDDTSRNDDDNASLLTVVAQHSFLDAGRTSSTLHRTLYVPYLHERAVANGQVTYQPYVLYRVGATVDPRVE